MEMNHDHTVSNSVIGDSFSVNLKRPVFVIKYA